MALCRVSHVPVSHCGFLVVLHMSQLELQMLVECDRVVFVLFVPAFDKGFTEPVQLVDSKWFFTVHHPHIDICTLNEHYIFVLE